MVGWSILIYDIKWKMEHGEPQDAARRAKLEWKASKRRTKQQYRLVKTKAGEFKGLVKMRWTTFVASRPPNPMLVSPVLHLHSTNDAPSDAEVKLVRDALEEAERERKRCLNTTGWELLENEVQPETTELNAIDEFIAGLKGLVSPLRRLPPEILQSIFLQGSYDRDMRAHSLRRYHPDVSLNERATGATYWPWTLSQVCRGWRQVCLSTPELWNYLPALVLKKAQTAVEKRRERRRFALMIERSRDSSLHLVVRGIDCFPVVHPILEMLIQESDRWETVTLALHWYTFDALFHPIKNRLRRLRYLEFYLTRRILDTLPTSIQWNMFSDTPCLQHVHFHTADNFGHINANHGPHDPHGYIPRAVDILVNNPNLHTLSLAICLDANISPPIILPNLKRFKIVLHQNNVPRTINALITPALEEFVVICYCGGYNSLPAICSLIRRSITATTKVYPLKKLHLNMQSVRSDLLIVLVEMLPQLTTLEAPLTRQGAEFIDRLMSVNPLTNIAPNLEYCKFHSLNFPAPALYSALNQLAKTRCCYAGLSSGSHASCARGGESERPFKRLKSLALEFGSVHILRRHQRLLEDDNELSRSQKSLTLEELDPPPSTIGDLVGLLYDAESSRGVLTASSYGRPVTEKLRRASAQSILEELEKCRLEDINIKDVYIPQVHLRLQGIEKWIQYNLPRVKRKTTAAVFSKLQKAIRDTLDEWYFALDEYTASIHWVAISTTVLMYVPSDDPFRSSSDSINLARVYDGPIRFKPFYEVFCQGSISDDL